MKFLITSGRKKGFTFEVVANGLKIGRRRDNDLVLDDESVSAHHAAILPEGDEFFVRDCDSINGVLLNGKSVKKSPLRKGDVVGVGMTEITVVSVGAETKSDAAEVEPWDAPVVEALPPRRPRTLLKSVVVLAGLVVVLAAAARFLAPRFPALAHLLKTPAAAGGGAEGGDFAGKFFRLYYEKVQASTENIFRYEMRVENGVLMVAVDDIRQQRHLRRNKPLDARQVALIRDAILEQQVLSLPPKIEGKSADMWDSWKLRAVLQGESCDLQVVNRIPPGNFKQVCAILERFGEAELGMVALSMSSEELLKRAKDAHQRARKLYDERSVNVENLSNSIKAYTETIWYLDTLDPKPAFYADAIHGKQVASDELDQQIKDHEFHAARSIQLQEWKQARDELALILQKLPESSDKRNQDAHIRLMDVEKRLQAKEAP